jgi:hypothetical protein
MLRLLIDSHRLHTGECYGSPSKRVSKQEFREKQLWAISKYYSYIPWKDKRNQE